MQTSTYFMMELFSFQFSNENHGVIESMYDVLVVILSAIIK